MDLRSTQALSAMLYSNTRNAVFRNAGRVQVDLTSFPPMEVDDYRRCALRLARQFFADPQARLGRAAPRVGCCAWRNEGVARGCALGSRAEPPSASRPFGLRSLTQGLHYAGSA